jgi:septal ring factor EnvC (AmiA/AmiB activator)
MRRWIPYLLPVSLGLLLALPASAQTSKELEEKRKALDKQLRTTSALLEQARKDQQVTGSQLQLLDRQVSAREELVRTMQGEVRRIDAQIRMDQEDIRSLEEDLAALKEDYGRMLQFAYRNRNAYDRLSYLFAASSFAQAYKRSRYLNQVAEHRRRQAVLIEETHTALEAKVEALAAQREEKLQLAQQEMAQKQALEKDRNSRQAALAALKKEESRLQRTRAEQEKQRKELDRRIRKAIEEELRAKSAAKPGTGFTLTPEARELNADFEKNRGKLPWPVEKGVITSRFGKQNHPVLPGIIIENNGVDIATEKDAQVRALFRGEVTSVLVIPGAGKAVIISHGGYRSVYSNLREVNVTKGQRVDTKQVIGTVITDEEGSKAHLELWRIGTDGQAGKVDPEQWLFR